MQLSAQEYANSAASYKNVVLPKTCSKRRGRSCTRREKNNLLPEDRIMRDKLAVSFARREFIREKNSFDKVGSTENLVSSEMIAKLHDNVKMCEGNLRSAHIAHAAMKQFPPLT